MKKEEIDEMLENAKVFFRDQIVINHIESTTSRACKLSEYNVNPFLLKYLANFLTGNDNSESIARALVFPRVLGSSISTSFGMRVQSLISTILKGLGSTTKGIDIEFFDALDGRKKYCQLKAGPNTINRDDVQSIKNHFSAVRNLARTNNLQVNIDDLIVGVLYGERSELSGHYHDINNDYPVWIGREFWHRLTGDPLFYNKLIKVFGEVAKEVDASAIIEDTIAKLSIEIEEVYGK